MLEPAVGSHFRENYKYVSNHIIWQIAAIKYILGSISFQGESLDIFGNNLRELQEMIKKKPFLHKEIEKSNNETSSPENFKILKFFIFNLYQ